MRKTRSLSILSLALAAAVAAPVAFAQGTTPPPQEHPQAHPQEQVPPTQAQVPQEQAQPAPATPEEAAQPAKQEKKSWADLDVDANGSLSATEVANTESLAKVFPQADADGNGELTPEEYKAWLAANGKGKPAKAQG